jgi:hypothetical protein
MWKCANPQCTTHPDPASEPNKPSLLNHPDRLVCFRCGKDWHYTPPNRHLRAYPPPANSTLTDGDGFQVVQGRKRGKHAAEAVDLEEEEPAEGEAGADERMEDEVSETVPFYVVLAK